MPSVDLLLCNSPPAARPAWQNAKLSPVLPQVAFGAQAKAAERQESLYGLITSLWLKSGNVKPVAISSISITIVVSNLLSNKSSTSA
jgi:hypothetical protein